MYIFISSIISFSHSLLVSFPCSIRSNNFCSRTVYFPNIIFCRFYFLWFWSRTWIYYMCFGMCTMIATTIYYFNNFLYYLYFNWFFYYLFFIYYFFNWFFYYYLFYNFYWLLNYNRFFNNSFFTPTFLILNNIFKFL